MNLLSPPAGTSALSALLSRCGFTRVVSIDQEPELIAEMQAKHPLLAADFHCADMLKPCSALVPDGTAELVVDKATLDCLLCNPLAAHELCATLHRMLGLGGSYVLMTLHPIAMIAKFLSFWFEFGASQEVERPVGENVRILSFFKVAHLPQGDAETTHEQQQQASVEAWYKEMNPLLTPEREAVIRAAWAAGAPERPPSEAYILLCDSDMRAELTLGDFLADVAESVWATKELWAVEDGLSFVRAVQ